MNRKKTKQLIRKLKRKYHPKTFYLIELSKAVPYPVGPTEEDLKIPLKWNIKNAKTLSKKDMLKILS